MNRWRSQVFLLVLLLVTLARGEAAIIEPRQATFMLADDARPPSSDDPRWQPTRLPDSHPARTVWYRIEFESSGLTSGEPWMLYLPYLYGGGKVWLNDEWIAAVQEASDTVRVSSERPQLLPLPMSILHAGRNVLFIRAASAQGQDNRLSLPALGPQSELQPLFDRRLFWVRTVPSITVTAGIGIGLFFLFIWWRRRDEALYGLFGLAALLWAVRTNAFVVDTWPASWWPAWRLVQHASTGGFVIVMALFALVLAGWFRRGYAWGLFAYWLIGPVLFVLGAARGEELTVRYWSPGLILIGVTLVAISFAAAFKQRSYATIALAIAMTLATASGVHDYLMAWKTPWLRDLAPVWAEQRIFLLHHGANLLLIVMGGC